MYIHVYIWIYIYIHLQLLKYVIAGAQTILKAEVWIVLFVKHTSCMVDIFSVYQLFTPFFPKIQFSHLAIQSLCYFAVLPYSCLKHLQDDEISLMLIKQIEGSMQSVGDKSRFLARNTDKHKHTQTKEIPLIHHCIYMQYVLPNGPFIRAFSSLYCSESIKDRNFCLESCLNLILLRILQESQLSNQ